MTNIKRRKGQTMLYKTLHQKQNIEHHVLFQKRFVRFKFTFLLFTFNFQLYSINSGAADCATINNDL
jgi:hypothetical protein